MKLDEVIIELCRRLRFVKKMSCQNFDICIGKIGQDQLLT